MTLSMRIWNISGVAKAITADIVAAIATSRNRRRWRRSSGRNQRRPNGWLSSLTFRARLHRISAPLQPSTNSARETSVACSSPDSGSRTVTAGPSGPLTALRTTTQLPAFCWAITG